MEPDAAAGFSHRRSVQLGSRTLHEHTSTASTCCVTATNHIFLFKGKNISGCTEEIYDTVVVNVIDKPQAFAGADTSIIYTPTFHLKGSGGSFYQWSPATKPE